MLFRSLHLHLTFSPPSLSLSQSPSRCLSWEKRARQCGHGAFSLPLNRINPLGVKITNICVHTPVPCLTTSVFTSARTFAASVCSLCYCVSCFKLLPRVTHWLKNAVDASAMSHFLCLPSFFHPSLLFLSLYVSQSHSLFFVSLSLISHILLHCLREDQTPTPLHAGVV